MKEELKEVLNPEESENSLDNKQSSLDYKQGLSQQEAKSRLKKYGYNEIKEIMKISAFKILLDQIKKNFVIYLLFVAMLISFFVGKSITGYTIFAVILIVVGVGFIQEYKAEKAIKALKEMIMPISIIIRNGKEQEILSQEIVPGDIIVLRTGEKIPADALIIEEKELYIDEALLTGESMPVKKIAVKNLKYLEKGNLIFMGTYVFSGKCIARVLHTGMNTEFGKIAKMISTAEKKLPLRDKINEVAKYMTIVAIIVSVLTGFLMLMRVSLTTNNIIEILLVVVALAVSAFPEGFPVVLITTLASGAYRMAKKNAIVNRMSIIETLGETTVICADKTGTITKGEMTVNKIYTNNKIFEVEGAGYSSDGNILFQEKKINIKNHKTLALLLKSAVLCNDARIERKGKDKEYYVFGNPTEASLLIMAAKSGLYKEDLNFERIEEILFTSERKMMSVLCQEKKASFVYSKGALEVLLEKCKYIHTDEGIKELNDAEKKKILSVNRNLTSSAFRVLALAYKSFYGKDKKRLEKNLVFLGVVAIRDPPRQEVKFAVQICKEAGINVKIITGDNKETAIAIAKEIRLEGKVITGDELEKITEDELSKIVREIVIFARVKPEHKLKIVKALKKNNEIVTMTGDGVNDAPALKEAHIGVAMASGTDVSKEVSDLTLKDDNFATIVSAVEEGRTIFNNIKKFITYQLSCNFAELFVIFIGVLIAPFLGWQIPLLLALQILFMNLVTDDLPAISLSFSPASLDAMKQKPRKKSRLLNKNLLIVLVAAGTIMGLFTIFSFYLSFNILKENIETARTFALLTLIFFEISNAFNFRSLRYPVHKIPFFANKYLVYASVASIIATIAIIYLPFFNKVFSTVPLGIFEWVFAFLISVSIIIIFDVFKIINNKKKILGFD